MEHLSIAWWQVQLAGLYGAQRSRKALSLLREAGFSYSSWTRRMEKIQGAELFVAPYAEFARLERENVYIPTITREALCSRCTGTGMGSSGQDENCRSCKGLGYLVKSRRVPRRVQYLPNNP